MINPFAHSEQANILYIEERPPGSPAGVLFVRFIHPFSDTQAHTTADVLTLQALTSIPHLLIDIVLTIRAVCFGRQRLLITYQ